MTTESNENDNFQIQDSSKLLNPVLEVLHASTFIEAAMKLDLRPSIFSDSVRRGRIADKIYLSLARHGFDIRKLIPKDGPLSIKEVLSKILDVEPETNVIAKALEVGSDDIKKCEEMEYITDKIYMALARKGYDIRQFWMDIES